MSCRSRRWRQQAAFPLDPITRKKEESDLREMLCRVPHRSISTRLQQRRCCVASAISVLRSAVQIALSSRQWSLTEHLFKSFARGFLFRKGSYDSSSDSYTETCLFFGAAAVIWVIWWVRSIRVASTGLWWTDSVFLFRVCWLFWLSAL